MAVSDYQGEEIIDSIVIKQGKKTFNKTYMPRTVFNDPDGKDAYIIGNGESRKDFDLYSLPSTPMLVSNPNCSETSPKGSAAIVMFEPS